MCCMPCCGCLRSRALADVCAAQEFRVTLDAMREVLAELAAAPARQASVLPGAASVCGSAAGAARWAGGWARWGLARADVAAMALSRRILLPRLQLHGAPGACPQGWGPVRHGQAGPHMRGLHMANSVLPELSRELGCEEEWLTLADALLWWQRAPLQGVLLDSEC